MDFQIKDKLFVVCGASSGFGRATANALLSEGSRVICIARRKEVLEEIYRDFPKAELLCLDLYKEGSAEVILDKIGNRSLDGILVNGGGPPAGAFMELDLESWDTAYHTVLRWKVDLCQRISQVLSKQGYGRILLIESFSVKQPVENLVLSNAFRSAVVGFAKTLSKEIVSKGVNVNIIAPGLHNTPAMQRLYEKKSEVESISVDEARKTFEAGVPVGRLGTAEELAVMAVYLLSPLSAFVTGQTICHAGGSVNSVFG